MFITPIFFLRRPADDIAPMATSEDSLRRALAEKQSTIDATGNSIRQLKSSGASNSEIDDAVKALNALKLEKTSIETQLKASVSGDANGSVMSRDAFRQAVVNTLERRLFYIPSFKIYRGVAGLYDYGPPGCAVKSNVLAFWRQVCRVLSIFMSEVIPLYVHTLLFCSKMHSTLRVQSVK